ncbi:MucBP domain-containing protein, partial [Enterococcus hulanensis]|uniref:MucBP domain-containing protein n=1 Tax=Enterococcus hulanensis TaxID=2559929 RepID=UPI001A8D6730
MSKRKLVYRREPIKKYRMHKVKKHWVVKSGVAGAMIVGTVAAPASSFIAQAAEADVMEDGEAFQTQELERTVDSSIPEMGETPVTTSEETEESEEEQTEETTSTEEPEGKTEETTEKETKSKTARTAKSSEKQTRATENEDGSKTWVANEDEGITVTNIRRITSDGGKAPSSYSDTTYHNGIAFTLTLSNVGGDIKAGDNIIIPITSDSDNIFSSIEGKIQNIGDIEFISSEEGFKLSVLENIEGDKKVEVLLAGDSTGQYFNVGYNSEINKMGYRPVNIYYSGELIETLFTTKIFYSIAGDNYSFSFYQNATANILRDDFFYDNPNRTGSILKGTTSLPVDDNVIQIERLTFESEAEIIDYTGKYKEDAQGSGYMYAPHMDGSGSQFYMVGSYDIKFRFVEIPENASNEEITTLLQASGSNSYGIVKNSDGSFTKAVNVSTKGDNNTLVDSEKYKSSGATSPVDFFEKTYGVSYSDCTSEYIDRINLAYSSLPTGSHLKIVFNFSDDTIPHTMKTEYSDSMGNTRAGSITSVPNKIAIQGQSSVRINFLDEEDTPLQSATTKLGFPTSESSPERAFITAEDLKVEGYDVDLEQLPVGADPLTGELYVDYPEEDQTTDITYKYKIKTSQVNVRYMLDTDGDGTPDAKINDGADDDTLEGTYNTVYRTSAIDYRSKNYYLVENPANAMGRYADSATEVTYVYRVVGNLVIDTSRHDGKESTTTPFTINSNNRDLADVTVPTAPAGFHYINAATNEALQNGAKLKPGSQNSQDPTADTRSQDLELRLVPDQYKVIYHYVDQEGKEVSPDLTEISSEGAVIPEKNKVVNGWLFVEKDAAKSDDDMLVNKEGLSEVTYVYQKIGSFVLDSAEPSFTDGGKIQYPNDPNDPSKILGHDAQGFPVIPYVPGYTPLDEDGVALEFVDDGDHTKGYKAPTIADPTKDTDVTYIINQGQITYKYVNQEGKAIAPAKKIASKFGDTIKEKIDVVNGWFYVEKDSSSDSDMIVNEDGSATVTYVYKKLGNIVLESDEPEFIGGSTQYENDPNDPSKIIAPAVPYEPGYIATDKDGNVLEYVDPEDPTKGYKLPDIDNPSEDTVVKYVKDDDESDSDSDSD